MNEPTSRADVRGPQDLDVMTSRELFQALADSSFEAIFLSDKGICIGQNRTAEEMFGWNLTEALGRPGTEWIVPEDRETVMNNMMRGVEDAYVVNALKRDGTSFPCEVRGRMIEYQGRSVRVTSLRDISDRMRTESELRDSERRHRALVEALPDLMFVLDADDCCIDYRTPQETMLYAPPSRFIGTPVEDLFPDAICKRAREAIDNVQNTGQLDIFEYELAIDGETKHYEARVSDYGDGHTVHIIRDITENVRLREHMSRSERLETAGHIAGQVAHDFNNLLAPLRGYPELIRAEVETGHPILEMIDSIEKAAIQMADINKQLLTLGRRGHYNLELLDVNEVLHGVLEELDAASCDIAVTTRFADDLLHVKGGRTQIQRAISNLLRNALEAMPGGGELFVSTVNRYADDDEIVFARIPRGEYVMISIRDTGVGIPTDIVNRVFDPFFTTKSMDDRRGSGLGLSVVDGVVKDHDGFIDLESRPGTGTTFHVYLPITRESVLTSDHAEITGKGETVLIVDDDGTQRRVTELLLTNLGYRVETAASGEEAVACIRDRDFDLVLLDMVMPGGMDGARTYERILEIRSDQPAIIMSGFSETDRVQAAKDLGAGAFLRKPVTVETLGLAVRSELDGGRVAP